MMRPYLQDYIALIGMSSGLKSPFMLSMHYVLEVRVGLLLAYSMAGEARTKKGRTLVTHIYAPQLGLTEPG
jgi:hypothetical protein